MNNRSISLILIALGVVVLVVSLGADVIGIGARAGFGLKQLLGAGLGSLAILVGIWLISRKSTPKK